jgi:hypothetical protein
VLYEPSISSDDGDELSEREAKRPRLDDQNEKPTIDEEGDEQSFYFPNIKWLNHVAQNRNDEWFDQKFDRLFKDTILLAKKHFGKLDIGLGPEKADSPWAAGGFKDTLFALFTENLADADPYSGGWDMLLLDRTQRTWLVVGIISCIMENRIFKELLFGATPEQTKLLHSAEVALLDSEGLPFS